jgi:hypothetical protein
MKYVSQMGAIYALTDANYREVFKRIVSDKYFELGQMGKLVVPDVDVDITDISLPEATEILNSLPLNPQGRRPNRKL